MVVFLSVKLGIAGPGSHREAILPAEKHTIYQNIGRFLLGIGASIFGVTRKVNVTF